MQIGLVVEWIMAMCELLAELREQARAAGNDQGRVERALGLVAGDRLAEASKAQQVLASCASTCMQFTDQGAAPAPPPTAAPPPAQGGNALEMYDSNGNGRITCAEASDHGIAPVRRDHPAYQYMDDRDNDGIVCE